MSFLLLSISAIGIMAFKPAPPEDIGRIVSNITNAPSNETSGAAPEEIGGLRNWTVPPQQLMPAPELGKLENPSESSDRGTSGAPAIDTGEVRPAPTMPAKRLASPQECENRPPEALNQQVTTEANKPIQIALGATDNDIGDSLTAAIVTPPQPDHSSVGQIDQNTGNVSYTPAPGFSGNDIFTFKVTDSH